MKRIGTLVNDVNDEICGAKDYAERYLQAKVDGDGSWANRYKEMANQELQHAMWLHELSVQEINKLKEVYTAPAYMQKKWDETHAKYMETVEFVKDMLSK